MTERDAERIELPGGLYMDADNEIHAADHEHLADVRFYPHCREIFAAAIRRPEPSADVVGLVDDALLARAVFEQRRPTEALHKAQHTARAAVLDAFAARDAEIERLTKNLHFWHSTYQNTIAAKDIEIERLKKEGHERTKEYHERAIVAREQINRLTAELVRLKAARVPEELRKLDELARPRGPVSYQDRFDPAFYQHRFQQAAADFVRSLLASEAAPAQARPGDALRDDRSYAIEHAEYMAKGADRLLDAINALVVAEDGARDDAALEAAQDAVTETRIELQSLVYEFRKRALRTTTAPAEGERT